MDAAEVLETESPTSRKKRKLKRKRSTTVEKAKKNEDSSQFVELKVPNFKPYESRLPQGCIYSAVEKLYKQHSVVSQSSKKSKKKSLNKTIDLCSDDVLNGTPSLNDISQNSSKTTDVEVVIDLSKDQTVEEIVDLTENSRICNNDLTENVEPTVIDLVEDEEVSNAQAGKKEVCDDILVVGMYSKSLNSQPPPKKKLKLAQNFEVNFIPIHMTTIKEVNSLTEKQKRKKSKKKEKKDLNKNVTLEGFTKAQQPNPNLAKIGGNIYYNFPVTLPTSGLRPVIIDGSNVAYVADKKENFFSCKRLEICIKYFKEKGHKVTAFVPQFRTHHNRSDDPNLLRKLERQGDVILTPSKRIDGRTVVPYDDRFIVQTAVLKGGVIVSRDNYNDLLVENPAWAETIKYRTLPFTWVDDVLMFPKDPLGEFGPTLEEFLKF